MCHLSSSKRSFSAFGRSAKLLKMAPQNPLPIYGNEKTMNLNSLILTNIQSSPYFKVNLFELKTYHEVIDEIFYKVGHLEPWEKGSRKTAGQTGMCGGVRGVGAGGIVSSAFCLLYKLFTLKLTRKQLIGLLTHADSCYIRALGFMYIRYTQPPGDLWEWYKDYMEDEEEVDVKAGGGHSITIGEMLRQWLTKLEWYSTLFPRIPVPIQKKLETSLREYDMAKALAGGGGGDGPPGQGAQGNQGAEAADPGVDPQEAPADDPQAANMPDVIPSFGQAARVSQMRGSPSRQPSPAGERWRDREPHRERERDRDRDRDRRPSPPFDIARQIEREKDRQSGERRQHGSRDKERRLESTHSSRDWDQGRDRDRDWDHGRDRDRDHGRDRDRERRKDAAADPQERHSAAPKERHRHKHRRHHRSRSNERHDAYKERHRSRSRERHRRKSRSPTGRSTKAKHRSPDGDRGSSFERDLKRERERHKHRDKKPSK